MTGQEEWPLEREHSCVFCDRIAAEDYDTQWAGDVVSFPPLNPVTEGHMLFLPRHHVTDAAVDSWITGAVFAGASQYAWARGGAFNLITSAGRAATQTIRHLHVHYVPRRFDDGLHLPWTGQRQDGLGGRAMDAITRPHGGLS